MKLEKPNLLDALGKCLTNAQELYDEAEILKQNGKLARAYTLYHMCIEEVGKTALIYKFFLTENIYENTIVGKFKKDFRDHKAKIEISFFFDKILSLMIENDDELKEKWENGISELHKKTKVYNEYKNLSLYASFYNNEFCTPSELFSEDIINEIKYFSKIRLNMSCHLYEVVKSKIDDY